MSTSTVTQYLNDATAQAQQGDEMVAQVVASFNGGDALLGFSGSAWTQDAGPISLQVWLDGEPVGGQLSIYANYTAMHMCLGRMWVYCPGVAPGQHKLAIVAGTNTITDQNDRVSLTLWDLGDGLAVRTATDTPCPPGVAEVLATDRAGLHGGAVLISGCGSGWVEQAGTVVSTAMAFDGATAVVGQVFANNDEQHLATVPVDAVYPTPTRGEHELQLVAGAGVNTDVNDYAHLTAVEWVNPADAPVQQTMFPVLQNYVAATQQGGEYVAQSRFQTSGGALLLRVSMSAWTPEANTMLLGSIEIDGNVVGHVELFANPAATHLSLVSNDLVVLGLPAGGHGFAIQSGASTYTDQNDSVSVLALEFPRGS